MKKLILPIVSALLSTVLLILSIPGGISLFACLQIMLSAVASALLLISVSCRACSIASICVSAPLFLINLWLVAARNFITLSSETMAQLNSPTALIMLFIHFGVVGCAIAQCSMLYAPRYGR